MKDKIDAFWFLEQPSGYISGTDLEHTTLGVLAASIHISTTIRPTCCTTSTMSSMASPMG